jgi:hypothetical protein
LTVHSTFQNAVVIRIGDNVQNDPGLDDLRRPGDELKMGDNFRIPAKQVRSSGHRRPPELWVAK